MIFDPEFYAKCLVPGIVELLSVVGIYDSKNAKPTDDGPPREVLDISLGDFSQDLGFYPLGEVVNSHHQESHLPPSPRE